MEFHSARQKFTAGSLMTDAAFSRKLPPGSHDMFGSRIVEASPEPIRNDQ